MEWNVIIYNWNKKEFEKYNIFDHYRFAKDCKEIAIKYNKDKSAFGEEIHKHLKYYFWSKSEWEIVLFPWPQHENNPKKKIDVYDQIAINLNQFLDYCWEHKAELKKLEDI